LIKADGLLQAKARSRGPSLTECAPPLLSIRELLGNMPDFLNESVQPSWQHTSRVMRTDC
jgi:hypothetical protein